MTSSPGNRSTDMLKHGDSISERNDWPGPQPQKTIISMQAGEGRGQRADKKQERQCCIARLGGREPDNESPVLSGCSACLRHTMLLPPCHLITYWMIGGPERPTRRFKHPLWA